MHDKLTEDWLFPRKMCARSRERERERERERGTAGQIDAYDSQM